ncbi:MAG: choice-of-anchor V domain-containing protein [Bacteroidota bacterium]
MKTNILFLSLILVPIAFMSFRKNENVKVEKYVSKNKHRYTDGSPTEQTGAPGEQNCTSCHLGTIQDGSSENQLELLDGSTPVLSYLPNSVYSVNLSMNSLPSKKGFQAVALDESNVMAGSFTEVSGNTYISSSGVKEYANHTSISSTNAISTWSWFWTAPSTNVGNVTFYIATNKANDNGGMNGDVIYLSQYTFGSTADLIENKNCKPNLTVGYSSENNNLILNFPSLSKGEILVNLIDLKGKKIFSTNLGKASIGENKHNVLLPETINNGIYIVNLSVNNRVFSAKTMIQ